MARRIAMKVAQRLPTTVSRDDLVSCALVGLTEAAARFDPTRDEPFPAFAEKRVRGAVLDELRRGDVMTRRGRQQARQARRVADSLEQELGRVAEDHEVAGALGMTVARYLDELPALTAATVVELSPALAGQLKSREEDPVTRLERDDEIARVQLALAQLSERDATVLSLYYLEDLKFVEIARVLGVTESRVCQLHGRALKQLRQLVGEP